MVIQQEQLQDIFEPRIIELKRKKTNFFICKTQCIYEEKNNQEYTIRTLIKSTIKSQMFIFWISLISLRLVFSMLISNIIKTQII